MFRVPDNGTPPFKSWFHLLCRHYFDSQWVSGHYLYPGGSMHTNNDPHFRNLIDNALVGIIDNTLEGKILFINQALASMLEFESPAGKGPDTFPEFNQRMYPAPFIV